MQRQTRSGEHSTSIAQAVGAAIARGEEPPPKRLRAALDELFSADQTTSTSSSTSSSSEASRAQHSATAGLLAFVSGEPELAKDLLSAVVEALQKDPALLLGLPHSAIYWKLICAAFQSQDLELAETTARSALGAVSPTEARFHEALADSLSSQARFLDEDHEDLISANRLGEAVGGGDKQSRTATEAASEASEAAATEAATGTKAIEGAAASAQPTAATPPAAATTPVGGTSMRSETLRLEALAHYRSAIRLEPTRCSAHKSLVKLLSFMGRLEQERSAAEEAVACVPGLWPHRLQRPDHYIPLHGPASRPWYEAEEFPFCAILEESFDMILDEFRAACKVQRHCQEVSFGERNLVEGRGTWKELVLLGPDSETGRRLCPKTTKLLEERVPGASALANCRALCGNAIFSLLAPKTALRAHCGPTNTRLTCHMGLDVPGDCGIRVGEETRTWHAGKCLVFDDSWEHEVWNNSPQLRTVLLVNFFHPSLPSRWHPDEVLCEDKYAK